MKIYLFGLLFLSASLGFSQDSEMTSATAVDPVVSNAVLAEGFKFSLVKPYFDLTETLLIREDNKTTKVEYDSSGGLAVGYVYLPTQNFGYTAQLAMYEAKLPLIKDSLNFARASVNIAFSADKVISALVGLNAMRFINNDSLSGLNSQVGFQGGVNFQINENFSAGATYYELNTSGLVDAGPAFPNYDQISRDVKTTGYEFDIGVTF